MMLATPSLVNAAALDRSEQQIEPLFEKGNYAELYYARVIPSIEGTDVRKQKIEDTAEDYNKVGAAVKTDAGDSNIALLLQYDQPWGVNTKYTSGILKGTVADIGSDALNAIIGYKPVDNFWLYGGVSYEQADGKVIGTSPFGAEAATAAVLKAAKLTPEKFAALSKATDPKSIVTVDNIKKSIQAYAQTPRKYQADFNQGSAWGYIAGFAYEYPEIALRADVTYRSATEHNASIDESVTLMTTKPLILVPKTTNKTKFKFPQSVNVNFKTGIMADTLLMTKFRWVNWKDFDVAPVLYKKANKASLASYGNDQFSGSIGIGRRVTDDFSAAVSLQYDSGTAEPYTPLGPYDEKMGVTLSGKYKVNDMIDVSAGVNYTKLGDAEIKSGKTTIAKFEGNQAIGIGTKVGFHF